MQLWLSSAWPQVISIEEAVEESSPGRPPGRRDLSDLPHLKKLELIGFKSFPDRQELHFTGDGVVAIVGPNGCGKSNISDAISWVLGEQSAKTLRGARMQDFIFSGSRDRKPSGVAQVSLTLVDPDGFTFPTPSSKKLEKVKTNGATNGLMNGSSGTTSNADTRPNEIVITRKLFRSGESQYLLNGRACRLRDIQDIFLGTGLGPNNYAIIEQGRIEQILSSRPVERRNFIEEAAGITKFKTRKRLAELKLEGARQNLNRVNDIFQEVTRQVNSLKRQAAKARRHEGLRSELNERLGTLIAGRHRVMNARLLDEISQKEAAEKTWQQSTEKLQITESEIEKLRNGRLQKDQLLYARHEELTKIALALERLKSRIEQQTKSAHDSELRGQEAQQELSRLDERIQDLSVELSGGKETLTEASRQVELVSAQLREKRAEVEVVRNEVHDNERTREQTHSEIVRLLGESSQRRNRMAQIDEFLAGNERQIARLAEEQSLAQEDVTRFTACHEEVAKRAEILDADIQKLTAQREEIEHTLSEARRENIESRRKTDSFQEEFSRLRARQESLDEILSHHAYTTESVKNLFAAIDQQPVRGFKPVGILADNIEVEPAFEKATEEFLHEELEYVVVRKWEEAGEGIEVLRRDVQGHATFLVHPETPVAANDPILGPETGVSGRLADVIRLTGGLSGSASTLLPRLRGCYLVDDDTLAQQLAIQHPDLYFLMPNGRCYQGYTLRGGKQRPTGPLALKRELRELGPKVARIEQDLAQISQTIERLDQQIETKTGELKSVSEILTAAEKKALAADHEIRGINEEKSRAQKRLIIVAEELERLRSDSRKSTKERDKQNRTIEELESARQKTENTLIELFGMIDKGRAAFTHLNEQEVSMRTELAGLQVSQNSASEALKKLRQAIEENTGRRDEAASRAEHRLAEENRLRKDTSECSDRIGLLAEKTQGLSEETEALRRSIVESADQIATAEPTLQVSRAELDQARDKRSSIEMRLVEIRSDLKHIAEDCLREIGRPLVEVLSDKRGELTNQQLAEAEKEHQELKEKLDGLGAVNVLALAEYKGSKERLEFLETQRKDLFDSIAVTEKTITEIDVVSSSKFQETFKLINSHFRDVFQTLFGGGAAEMRLTDEENAGESGVDIIASPPGKRLQNVALLSGGEKSLTAVALLMATFRHRPSPFCVLDEVDAPLDEPNLLRFSRLVREMSEHTQFILITHSRTTMETAQTLYGVTMQQPGVSELVSVRMAAQKYGDFEPAQTLA